MGIITLTTDFGLADPFVGIMKGVILGIAPNATVVDLTHHVPSYNITAGSWVVRDSWRFFPEGTVHVAVVDPGVGSERRPLVVSWRGHFFVGPDNGIFSFSTGEGTAYHLTEDRFFLPDISATFHGRDIFAPVAAHISRGVSPALLGRVINDPVRIDTPLPVNEKWRIRGEVIRLDRFGNAVTNIEAGPWQDGYAGRVKIRGRRLQIVDCYAGIRKGEAGAIMGSSGRIEIFVNQGNAAALLGITAGEEVTVE